MEIRYEETLEFSEAALERLFLSVNWESARFPDRLAWGLRHSTHVISAWDGDRLVGLVRALDDGATVAFLHYLLVDPEYQGRQIGDALMRRVLDRLDDFPYVKIMPSDPKTIPFYERYGFKQYDNYSAMVIKRF